MNMFIFNTESLAQSLLFPACLSLLSFVSCEAASHNLLSPKVYRFPSLPGSPPTPLCSSVLIGQLSASSPDTAPAFRLLQVFC